MYSVFFHSTNIVKHEHVINNIGIERMSEYKAEQTSPPGSLQYRIRKENSQLSV